MAYDKLQSMLDAAMKQAGEESSMLLGQPLTVAASDVLNADRKSYLGGDDRAIYVVGVESREAYPGRFYLLFSLADTIVMSSILLGIPGPRIQEKRRLSIQEPDDADAFGEIANQIIGSFNSVFQPNLPEKVHLKLLPPIKYVPEVDPLDDELPFPDGNYMMYRAPLEIEGQEMDHLDILIPHPLACLFDPQPEEAAAEAPEQAEETPEEAPAEIPSILVLGDDNRRQELIDGLETKLALLDAPLSADLPQLFSGGNIKLALISLRQTADRDLSICKRVVPMVEKTGGAVVLCAPEWTRVSVLKALKAGARGIISYPLDASDLNAKVSGLLSV
ncbi:Adenylate cyclase [Citrifermentans bremense]|uniref:Adenylate cyclase n=1 Tax=Citrifermentans bremense TaxID=60035 RepID=A0A6S6MC20_9BACT|nr:response regulator [Citrifermentans bremense]BCG48985.1 Adenylate cyclase [Citrifermentans bremense]